MTSIGDNAFRGCTGLTSVTIGSGVTSIGNYAFYDCTGLTHVNYTGTLAKWCGISFADAYANPIRYAKNLYLNNSLLTNAVIPDSVDVIGAYAFYNCQSLESVTICNSVTGIGDDAFYSCTNLASATIGNRVTSIPSRAFSNCKSLERVTVGENVQSIGTQAFFNCTSLRRVLFRGDKVSIAYNAFENCGDYALCCREGSYWHAYAMRKGLQYILIDETAATEFAVENGVLLSYDGASARITLPSCVTAVDYEAFRGNDTVTRVALPQSVTTVSDYAFADCANLAEVFIPDAVTSIGANAFSGSHPTVICFENSYAHKYAKAHSMTVKFVRILIDLENAVMRVEIPYANESEVSLVHLTGVSLQVIGLGSMPKKTVYRVGEALDADGLSIEARYTNGMTSVLRDGFTVSAPVFSAPGEKTVTLRYCGQKVDFTVTVTDDVVSGDADGSGKLDLRDVALLSRDLAGGWNVDLTGADTDVNKDGIVDLKDVVILRRYLAGGWGVQLA